MEIVVKTLRMPKKLSNILKEFAREEGHTQNSLILQILWDWEKKQRNKIIDNDEQSKIGEKTMKK